MPEVRILLVHAQRTFTAALTRRLEGERNLHVVGAVPSGLAARAALDTLDPDVVVVGSQLDGDEDGIDLLAGLTTDPARPPHAIMLLEETDAVALAVAAVRAGALVVVPSDGAADDLVRAIHRAARGEAWVPPQLLAGVLHQLVRGPEEDRPHVRLFERLTDRESEILRFLVAGHDRVSIAADLELSPNTVRTHVGNILRKLEVHSTLEAVTLAYASGVFAEGMPSGPWN